MPSSTTPEGPGSGAPNPSAGSTDTPSACPATFVRATPRSATSGCITSRPARGRWSCCCTASPSSGTAGGSRSSRSRRRDSASSHPTRAATTCHRSRNGVKAYDIGLLAADIRDLIHERGAESALLVGHDWGGSIAWATAMNHPEVVDRLAILNAAHPRKLSQGLHHPGQLRKSWYFFFFDLPDLPETVVHANHWHFFRHFLHDARPAFTPEETDRYIEAWSQPGAATGMINYYRSSVRASQKKAEAALRPIKAPTLVIWGQRDRYLGPELAEPDHDDVPNLDRVRAPARRVALGAPRRGRARHPAAHRLLRPSPAHQQPLNLDEVANRPGWPVPDGPVERRS